MHSVALCKFALFWPFKRVFGDFTPILQIFKNSCIAMKLFSNVSPALTQTKESHMFLTVLIGSLACACAIFASHNDKDKTKTPTTTTTSTTSTTSVADTGTYDQNESRNRDVDPSNIHGDCTGNTPEEPWQGTSK